MYLIPTIVITICVVVLFLLVHDAFGADIKRRRARDRIMSCWQKMAETKGYSMHDAQESAHESSCEIPLPNGAHLKLGCRSAAQETVPFQTRNPLGPSRSNISYIVLDNVPSLPLDVWLRPQAHDRTLARVLGDGADSSSFMTTVDFNAAAQPLMSPEHLKRRQELAELLHTPHGITVGDGMVSWSMAGVITRADIVLLLVERILRIAELLQPVFVSESTPTSSPSLGKTNQTPAPKGSVSGL